MRELNQSEIEFVAGGNAAENGARIGGEIGSIIDAVTGIFGIKLHMKDVISSVGGLIGGIVDAIRSKKEPKPHNA
ncbi:TPA: hypothetical protein J1246_004293 [Escherichia coli]|nr:hypothetical protein [Escherichia coli]EHC6854828.1 hypothetical protein [Salmonella enterica subsp. enterica]EIQ4656753.1 hypothetical protein [Escherichia coli]KUS82053.1 hypothetical protein AWE77_21465 [Escherichia coli]HAZ3595929.1 hypothetical protein [Escherichia coli]